MPGVLRPGPRGKRGRASLVLLLTRNVSLIIPEGCGEGSQGCAVFRATPGMQNTRRSRPGRGAGNRRAQTYSKGATPTFARTARQFPAPLPRCESSITSLDPGVRGVPRPLATFVASLQDAPARRSPPPSNLKICRNESGGIRTSDFTCNVQALATARSSDRVGTLQGRLFPAAATSVDAGLRFVRGQSPCNLRRSSASRSRAG